MHVRTAYPKPYWLRLWSALLAKEEKKGSEDVRELVHFEIESFVDPKWRQPIQVLVAKIMTGLFTRRDIPVPIPDAFKNINLADFHFDKSGRIDRVAELILMAPCYSKRSGKSRKLSFTFKGLEKVHKASVLAKNTVSLPSARALVGCTPGPSHPSCRPNDPILDSEITNADIYKEIAGSKSNKACGPDGIPNEVLKILPDSYILLLKQLYNSVMTTGKYPAIWTNSTIHPIFKNGYKNSPSNYRGIALFSNVSKLFTSILRSKLEEWVEGRRVIPENQAGFRKGRSCIDHIFTLTTLIQLSLRKKRRKLYDFFVDLRKAFDTVPHSILWKKLYNLGISYHFISTIRSYYEQATIAIRWKGSFMESIKINSGVLQGEPLSSLLFILFITDLIEIYNNSDLRSVNLPEFGDIHLLLYADDIAIIGETRINLQKKIKILKEYLDENLMTLNESKSKIMVFRNGALVSFIAQIRLMSTMIKENHIYAIKKEDLYCGLCGSQITDEIYHFIAECGDLEGERKKILKSLPRPHLNSIKLIKTVSDKKSWAIELFNFQKAVGNKIALMEERRTGAQ
ncbi:hypothetical protein LAZ67_8001451 [Cordylochernes scorpioides]|uniref:Reverse transcriptase domain-containing protein n=1 Tax=Cordylochernes scorpioides TaxID=51811 RepID=A0ABY6KQ84_9ARAC|nr:hypothetical protein LAZ67_8001451 [Cordylochernes scorpioides]